MCNLRLGRQALADCTLSTGCYVNNLLTHDAKMNRKIVQVFSRIEGGEAPLKVIRETLGLSQFEFAAKLGVSLTTVSRWENGHNKVTLTIPQVKVLDTLLGEIGLRFSSLPDDLGPPVRVKG